MKFKERFNEILKTGEKKQTDVANKSEVSGQAISEYEAYACRLRKSRINFVSVRTFQQIIYWDLPTVFDFKSGFVG